MIGNTKHFNVKEGLVRSNSLHPCNYGIRISSVLKSRCLPNEFGKACIGTKTRKERFLRIKHARKNGAVVTHNNNFVNLSIDLGDWVLILVGFVLFYT